MMETPGIPSTRWFDAAMLPKDQVAQKDNLKAMMVIGPRRQHRHPHAGGGQGHREARPAGRRRSASDHLGGALASARTTPTCCRSAPATRRDGSRTASNRSLQWGEQIVKPIFESKDDYEVMYLLAKKLGFADRMFKNIKVENNVPVAEDILREINRGGWSTGYCGQSPERLKAHMKNQDKFDLVTLRAPKDAAGGRRRLLRPAVAVLGHAGDPASRHAHALQHQPARQGRRRHLPRPLRRRASKSRSGERHEVEKEVKHNLLAEGSYSKDSEIKDGYPEFTYGVLKKLGWDKDLTEAETGRHPAGSAATTPDAVSWSIDLSGGIQRVAIEARLHPLRQRQGARQRVRNLPDADPGAPRADLHAAARPGREISDAAERAAVPHAECRLRRAEGRGGRRASPSNSRSSSPRAAWSNTKAAARRPAPTSGSPSCSRTCSSRSIRRMPPSAASRTAAGSG